VRGPHRNGRSRNGGTGHGTLTLDKQFWMLGTIPKGTFAHGSTWVLAATGCFPGLSATEAESCPATPSYSSANGDLSLAAWELDSKVAALGELGFQFANASPAWDRACTSAGGVTTTAGVFTGGPGAGLTLNPITEQATFARSRRPSWPPRPSP